LTRVTARVATEASDIKNPWNQPATPACCLKLRDKQETPRDLDLTRITAWVATEASDIKNPRNQSATPRCSPKLRDNQRSLNLAKLNALVATNPRLCSYRLLPRAFRKRRLRAVYKYLAQLPGIKMSTLWMRAHKMYNGVHNVPNQVSPGERRCPFLRIAYG